MLITELGDVTFIKHKRRGFKLKPNILYFQFGNSNFQQTLQVKSKSSSATLSLSSYSQPKLTQTHKTHHKKTSLKTKQKNCILKKKQILYANTDLFDKIAQGRDDVIPLIPRKTREKGRRSR